MLDCSTRREGHKQQPLSKSKCSYMRLASVIGNQSTCCQLPEPRRGARAVISGGFQSTCKLRPAAPARASAGDVEVCSGSVCRGRICLNGSFCGFRGKASELGMSPSRSSSCEFQNVCEPQPCRIPAKDCRRRAPAGNSDGKAGLKYLQIAWPSRQLVLFCYTMKLGN